MWLNIFEMSLNFLHEGIGDRELVDINLKLQKTPISNGVKLHDLGRPILITETGNYMARK